MATPQLPVLLIGVGVAANGERVFNLTQLGQPINAAHRAGDCADKSANAAWLSDAHMLTLFVGSGSGGVAAAVLAAP